MYRSQISKQPSKEELSGVFSRGDKGRGIMFVCCSSEKRGDGGNRSHDMHRMCPRLFSGMKRTRITKADYPPGRESEKPSPTTLPPTKIIKKEEKF